MKRFIKWFLLLCSWALVAIVSATTQGLAPTSTDLVAAGAKGGAE